MAEPFHVLEAKGVRVVVDLRVGHVRAFSLEHGGRTLTPLHTAPWVDDPSVTQDQSLPGNLRFLSGDFFCAPFATSDVEPAPLHGWPANSPWRLLETLRHVDGVTGRYELERNVMGARLVKEFTLRDRHPFLYQRHVFIDGTGAVPVANHAMTRFAAGGTLSFSPKAYAATPDRAQETDPARGRSRLAYPARFTDLTRAPTVDGTTADLTRYPFADRHEDFVMLVEAPGGSLGWAAAARPDRGDLFLSLKHPGTYPVTFLWFSNGGRDYAPWNGRHVGVLGVEEGRSLPATGHRASIEPNDMTRAGIPTALALVPRGEAEVRNVIGGLAIPQGWARVADIVTGPGRVEVVAPDGARLSAPFDDGFLGGGSPA
jgi:hypothetical protein